MNKTTNKPCTHNVAIAQLRMTDVVKVAELETLFFDANRYEKSELINILNNQNAICLKAVVSDNIVGYILVTWVSDMADLLKIAVDNNYQKCGVGKKLFTNSKKLLMVKGVKKIFLEVKQDNDNAINFYNLLGFEVVKVRKNYYKDGVDALEMMIKL